MPIYKKVKKEKENYYGVEVLRHDESVFEKPCLISLAAQPGTRHNVGVMTRGIEFSRVKIHGDNASGVLVQDMDVSFLTRDQESKVMGKKSDICDDMISQLHSLINSTRDIQILMKKFRNINFVSYCDGYERVNKAIDGMVKVLQEEDFSDKEIQKFFKNIIVFSFAKDSIINPLVTSFSFVDVQDNEGSIISDDAILSTKNSDNPDGICIKKVKDSNQHKVYFSKNPEHTIDYMKKGEAIPCIVARLVTYAIENSRLNYNETEMIPFDSQNAMKMVNEIIARIKDGEKGTSILEEIDSKVYLDRLHSSQLELDIADQIDVIAKKLSNINVPIEESLDEYKRSRSRFVKAASKHLSREQMEYVLTGKGMIVPSKDELKSKFSEAGEKQIRNCYNYEKRRRTATNKEAEIDKVVFGSLGEFSEDDSKYKTIVEMIEIKRKKLHNYDNNSRAIAHLDETIMQDIYSRIEQITSVDTLAKILLEYDSEFFAQCVFSDEDDAILDGIKNNGRDRD